MKHIVNGNWIIPQDTRREYILDIRKVYDKEPKAEVRLETVKTKDAEETINEKGIWHLKNTHLRGVWTLLKTYTLRAKQPPHLKVISKPISKTTSNGNTTMELVLKEYIYQKSSNPLDEDFVLPLEEVYKLKKNHITLMHNNHFRVIKTWRKEGKKVIRNYGTVRDLDTANRLYEVMKQLGFPEEFVTGHSRNPHLLKIQAMCKNHSVNEVLDWVRKEYPHVCPEGADSCDTGSAEVEDESVTEENDEPVFTYTQSQLEEKIKQAVAEVFKNGNI